MSEIRWVNFSSPEMQDCYRIRWDVFVHEQAVPEDLEIDQADQTAKHALISVDGSPAGTARLLLDTPNKGEAKIGRVATLAAFRGRGLASALMRFLEAEAARQGQRKITLDAQVAVIPLYERLGYVAFGPIFDDAGIDHRKMSRSLTLTT